MLLLGYVKEINAKVVVIGLPNGLNGYISVDDVQMLLQQVTQDTDDDQSDDDNIDEETQVRNKFENKHKNFLKWGFPCKLSVIPWESRICYLSVSNETLVYSFSLECHNYIFIQNVNENYFIV